MTERLTLTPTNDKVTITGDVWLETVQVKHLLRRLEELERLVAELQIAVTRSKA